jgi:hypothetical protein
MSLITQQRLLQAQSERDDVLRRISFGEDSKGIKNLLTDITKRIEALQKQMETERAKALETKKSAEAKQDKQKGGAPRRPDARGPLPDDMEIPCSDCTNVFSFSGKDQIFFQKQGWEQPLRCTDCREVKKTAKLNAAPKGKAISCEGCKTEIFFTDAKARLFQEKGWAEPKRCSSCKANRQAAYETKKAAAQPSAPTEAAQPA